MNGIEDLPLVSVVIVNYNRRDDLREAIKSIKEQDWPAIEVVVVENASTDGSEDMLREEFPDVKCIRLDRNIGMDGYSVGCRAAQGSIIFQMDNDSIMPEATVITKITEAFKGSSDDVAIIATHVEEFRKGVHDADEFLRKKRGKSMIATMGYHAGGVAFRKALMDKVGYYNEDVFLYGAELFVQANVLAAGYKMFYLPEVVMFHCASGAARSPKAVYYEVRNRYWFMRHFGNMYQRAKYLPPLLLHDIVYAVKKKALGAWWDALVDGFGKLPESLKSPNNSKEPLLLECVDSVGREFAFSNLVRRVVNTLTLSR